MRSRAPRRSGVSNYYQIIDLEDHANAVRRQGQGAVCDKGRLEDVLVSDVVVDRSLSDGDSGELAVVVVSVSQVGDDLERRRDSALGRRIGGVGE